MGTPRRDLHLAGSLRGTAVRGTLVNGAFTVALTTLGLLRGFVVAAFLLPSDYGVWGIIVIAIGGLYWFREVGISDKYIQQDEDDQELAFQKAFTLEAIFTGAFTLVAIALVPVVALVYGRPELIAPGIVVCLGAVAMVLQAPIWVLYRRLQFVRQRAMLAVDPIVSFVVTVVLAVAGLGYWSLVVGVFCGAWAAAALAVWKSPYPLRLRYDRGTMREYLSFSWPIFYGQGSRFVLVQAPILVANWKLGLVAVGFISLAGTIAEWANKVDAILSQSLYPLICAVKDRRDVLYESFVKSNRLALMWGVPFGVGVALFIPDLVTYVLGEERWGGAVALIQVFGLLAAANHLAYNWDDYFRALGDTRPMAAWATLSLVSTLATTVPLMLLFGLDGYMAGMAATTLVSLAGRFWFLGRIFPRGGMLLHCARSVAPSVPAACVVLFARLVEPARTEALVLAEVAAYLAVTVVATALIERSLVREVLGYLRRRPAVPAPAAFRT
jgi:PST family polysaccharide transporter